MTKEIRLNAFDMNCVGHIQHGMWTHLRDRSTECAASRRVDGGQIAVERWGCGQRDNQQWRIERAEVRRGDDKRKCHGLQSV